MELLNAIEKRSSVRKFLAEKVEPEDLKKLVYAAGLAPSINNSQPWKFIAVTNQQIIRQMSELVHQKINKLYSGIGDQQKNVKKTVEYFSTVFENAPALIAVATTSYTAVSDQITGAPLNHQEMNEQRRHPDIQSIGAAVQNMLLAAVDMGYGACWLSGLMVAKEELELVLKVESPWELATVVAVGKPAGESTPKEKKSVDEIFELLE
jgi:nitroreductase